MPREGRQSCTAAELRFFKEAREHGMSEAKWREEKPKWEKREREARVAREAQAAADAAIGLRQSTDKEIVLGAPPCKFEILQDDSQECKAAKIEWNAGNRDAFSDSRFSGFAAAADRFGIAARFAQANKDVNEHCRKNNDKYSDQECARNRERYSTNGRFNFREACEKVNQEKSEKSSGIKFDKSGKFGGFRF